MLMGWPYDSFDCLSYWLQQPVAMSRSVARVDSNSPSCKVASSPRGLVVLVMVEVILEVIVEFLMVEVMVAFMVEFMLRAMSSMKSQACRSGSVFQDNPSLSQPSSRGLWVLLLQLPPDILT